MVQPSEDYEQKRDIPNLSKYFEGDGEMALSEVGTKDLELEEII